jgi:hypothetical protein
MSSTTGITPADQLDSLADKVEALSGPNFQIERDIFDLLAPEPFKSQTANYGINAPRYTASLDAAMTLVPESYWLESLSDGISATKDKVSWISAAVELATWTSYGSKSVQGIAHTRSNALTAAALRARAAIARGK